MREEIFLETSLDLKSYLFIKLMNSHRKLVLNLYRLHIKNCMHLGYNLGTLNENKAIVLKRSKSKYAKYGTEIKLKNLDEDQLLNYVYWIFENRKIRNKGAFIFFHIKQYFKDCKNLKFPLLTNYVIDLGFKVHRYISEIIFHNYY